LVLSQHEKHAKKGVKHAKIYTIDLRTKIPYLPTERSSKFLSVNSRALNIAESKLAPLLNIEWLKLAYMVN
jgi:hypothetical protein